MYAFYYKRFIIINGIIALSGKIEEVFNTANTESGLQYDLSKGSKPTRERFRVSHWSNDKDGNVSLTGIIVLTYDYELLA